MSALSTRNRNPWWIGTVCGMASYIDAASIVCSGISLVIYQHALGLSDSSVGTLSAALTFCIAVGALSGGRLGDRYGRRSVFLVTMCMIIVGAIALATAATTTGLLVGVVLVGIGTGADLPVSLATISEAASDDNRGKILGLSQILWSGGILSSVLLATFVGDMGRVGGQIMYAHIGVVAAVVLAFRLTIPESAAWAQARDEMLSGARTVRAERTGFRDLKDRLYLLPFLALLGFYTLTNIGANTGGQFSTLIAVNAVGLSVSTNSTISLVLFPLGIVAAAAFMRVVDTRYRMVFFAVGAAMLAVSYLVPALIGFNITTWLIYQVLNNVGGSFCFEAIMKVWTQESFPTLLRGSAQGGIIAFARVVAAVVALFTPRLSHSPQLLFGSLFVIVTVGLLIGWVGFHGRRANLFDIEEKDLAQAQLELVDQGLRADAPAAEAAEPAANSAAEQPAGNATGTSARPSVS
ncbi:MAG: MFS transporter [Gordonia sp. (in: high G+C Gram-positive bacteria)]